MEQARGDALQRGKEYVREHPPALPMCDDEPCQSEAVQLLPHQQRAYAAALRLEASPSVEAFVHGGLALTTGVSVDLRGRSGGLLCTPTGAGKTWVVGALAAASAGQTLVAVPPNLVRQWTAELARMGLRASALYGARKVDWTARVLVTSWGTMRKRKLEAAFERLVVDEAHTLSPSTGMAEAVVKAAQDVRAVWLLTATPFAKMDSVPLYARLLGVPSNVCTAVRLADSGMLWRACNPTQMRQMWGYMDADPIHGMYDCIIVNRMQAAMAVGCLLQRIVYTQTDADAVYTRHTQYVRLPPDYLTMLRDHVRYQLANQQLLRRVTRALSLTADAEDFPSAHSMQVGRTANVQAREGTMAELVQPQFAREARADGTDCAVCLDGIDRDLAALQPCGHVFHFECITRFLATRNTCPLCRVAVAEVLKISDGESAAATPPQSPPPPPPPPDTCTERMQQVLARASGLLAEDADNRLVLMSDCPIVARAAAERLGCAVVTGATSMAAKHRLLGEFQQRRHRALVLTYGVAAVGVNLTAANHLLYIDPPPTTAVAQQSVGRLVRVGQDRHVHVHAWPVHGTYEMSLPRSDRRGIAVRLH